MSHVLATMEQFDLAHSERPLPWQYWHQVFVAEQNGKPVNGVGISRQRLRESSKKPVGSNRRRPDKYNFNKFGVLGANELMK
jgi:hypothetical protein